MVESQVACQTYVRASGMALAKPHLSKTPAIPERLKKTLFQQVQNLSDPLAYDDPLYLAVEQFFKPRKSEPTTRDIDFLSKGQNLALKCGLAATAWGDGPPVLLAHGWESRRSHWSAMSLYWQNQAIG